MTTVVDDRPTFPLANLLELPDGRLAEWESIGSGEPLLWIEGGPGLPAHLARPDVALVADRFRAQERSERRGSGGIWRPGRVQCGRPRAAGRTR